MRNRRTKDQIQRDIYNSEVDAYNWYVVNLKTQKVESGFEYKSDAIDLLNDFDDKKQYKVVAKKTLKSMGIEIPNESWKYAKGGSLEAHGIKEGDTFIKTVSGTIQKVKDKNGNIVFIDLSNGYRDSQPPLPFAMGGYTDLSKSKPEVMNESKMLEYDVEVPEIDIEKIRTIDLNIDNNKILSLDDSIRVLKQIYDKGSINAYEEVKILFLDNSNKVIGIYNHSKGGITGTVIDVEMICALALKCLAKGVIMSHNHPSGSLRFSDADIKVSKELKNALNLFRIALLDSIVITENGFTSMTNEGIFANGGSLSRFDNGGDLGIEEEIDLTDDNRLRVRELTYEYKKPTSKELAEKHNSGAYEFMEQDKFVNGGALNEHQLFVKLKNSLKPTERGINESKSVGYTMYEKNGEYSITRKIGGNEIDVTHNFKNYFPYKSKMMSGGKTTFNDKSNAIAKRFVGKKVEPKYQKEYGKVYSKDEAKEVGNKITGSMVSKEKMMAGGKTKKGNGEAMLLAKKIRKDGEKWTDAVKRAWLQLR
jgi:DNA repair protein RadC